MNLLKKIVIIMFCCIFMCGCYDEEAIENLAIAIGFGYDIEKNDETRLVSAIEFIYIKKKDEADSDVFVGKGDTIYSSIANYKVKQSKPFGYGAEIVYLISEERAKFGIEDIVLDLFRHSTDNINAKIIICKGQCKDYFSLKSHTGTASEELADIVEFSNTGNFYSDHYTVNDFLLMYYQQGREVYLPSIGIINNILELTGATIFKKDKMLKNISIEEVNLINILRDSGGNGIIKISSDKLLDYLEMEGKNKVKVKVSTEDNHLKYNVFVNVSGELRIDTLYGKELTKEQVSKLEKTFEDKLQKDLNDEVKKVQNEYGVDCLDFSKYALAKYGRDSGYDSEEYFSDAKIKVHVDVRIKSIGRIYRNSMDN